MSMGSGGPFWVYTCTKHIKNQQLSQKLKSSDLVCVCEEGSIPVALLAVM